MLPATPPTPPLSPRQSPNSVVAETKEIRINHQPFQLTHDVAKLDVIKALSGLRADPEHARDLKKELILNAELLIGLMNAAKLEVQHKRPYNRPCLDSDRHYSDSIELAFIENKHLSADESEWVKEAISNYKQRVQRAVVQNNPAPIAPPPSVIRLITAYLGI